MQAIFADSHLGPILILTILRSITVILGAVFLAFTWRAYRRHRASSLLVLLIAVGLLTLGAVVEGLAIQALGFSIGAAHVIESGVVLVAFTVLVYSVLAHKVE